MKSKWICEICEEEFDSQEECLKHEKECNPEISRTCHKCGKTESWHMHDSEAWINEEMWHHVNLGRPGYGSGLDGSDVVFELCDKCLCEFISTFVHRKKIYNSGSNCFGD
jgi:hypothetical protein